MQIMKWHRENNRGIVCKITIDVIDVMLLIRILQMPICKVICSKIGFTDNGNANRIRCDEKEEQNAYCRQNALYRN